MKGVGSRTTTSLSRVPWETFICTSSSSGQLTHRDPLSQVSLVVKSDQLPGAKLLISPSLRCLPPLCIAYPCLCVHGQGTAGTGNCQGTLARSTLHICQGYWTWARACLQPRLATYEAPQCS